MGKTSTRSMGAVLAFPEAADRPVRAPLSLDEPRGEILLFTGVRYERIPERGPEPSRPAASDGRGRRRRRS